MPTITTSIARVLPIVIPAMSGAGAAITGPLLLFFAKLPRDAGNLTPDAAILPPAGVILPPERGM